MSFSAACGFRSGSASATCPLCLGGEIISPIPTWTGANFGLNYSYSTAAYVIFSCHQAPPDAVPGRVGDSQFPAYAWMVRHGRNSGRPSRTRGGGRISAKIMPILGRIMSFSDSADLSPLPPGGGFGLMYAYSPAAYFVIMFPSAFADSRRPPFWVASAAANGPLVGGWRRGERIAGIPTSRRGNKERAHRRISPWSNQRCG